MALGGWLLCTRADETSMSILRQSVWSILLFPALLAIPLGIAAFMADFVLVNLVSPAFLYLAGMIGLVLFEEVIKFRAARLRRSGIQAFALVSLFGIYELALIKPILMWGVSASGTELFWLQASLLPAVALHVLTAAIYAFHFEQSPAKQFLACAGIHFLFNLAADNSGAVGDPIWLATILPLIASIWLLIPRAGSARRGSWEMERVTVR